MVQLSGLTFDRADTIEMMRDGVRLFAARLYAITVAISEIRCVLIGRDLYAETL